MNTETTAVNDVLGQGRHGTAGRDYERSRDKLLADLKFVVADTQQLIKEAADCSVEGYAALRAKCADKLGETRGKIDQARAAVTEKAQHSADAAHAYVKENPWTSMGISAAAGVIIGLLLWRR